MPPSDPWLRHLRPIALAAFLLALILPPVGMLLGSDPGQGGHERRRLASAPTLDLLEHSPRRYFAQLKRYLPDHFCFRGTLVQWYANLMLGLFHASPSREVILGSEGWFYYAGERTIDDYRCVSPFSDSDLDSWQAMLERRRAWLAERGIRYLVVIAPNTPSVYPEYLPGCVRRVASESRLDLLVRRLRERTRVELLDLRWPLIQAKPSERVYERTDTH